jgi:hypothetical protein
MAEQSHPRTFADDPAQHETVVADGVSFENFLGFFADKHAEWLMGKVILIVTNNTRHQMLQGFLYNLISYFLGVKKIGRILMAGVREYWLIDPQRTASDIWELSGDGRYRRRPLDAAGRITSGVLPGFALDPELLWQDEHPAGPDLAALVEQMLGDAA